MRQLKWASPEAPAQEFTAGGGPMLQGVRAEPEQRPATGAASRWRSSWRALGHRNYRLYFWGQAVSLLGSWIQQVALGWLVYRLTGSPLLLGAVAFLSQAPQLVGAPLAGIVIDRSDRRRLMLQVQFLLLLQALSLALLSELGWIQPWHILLAAAALGILRCFDAPLRHALAVQLVDDRNDLPNAVALNSLTFNVARFVGPPVAGLALGLTSEAACFALNGLSFVAVITALLRIRLAPAKPTAGAFGEALREGLLYTMENLPVRGLLLQVAILNFLAACYVPLMPAFASDVFHGGPDTLGLLLGSAGAGALAHQAWLGMALLFLVGFGLIIANASSNTILQAILPDHLRGRVLALYTSVVLGSVAAGGLIAGLVAERAGVQLTFLGIGIVLLLAVLRFRAQLELLRAHLRPLYQALGIPPRPARNRTTKRAPQPA